MEAVKGSHGVNKKNMQKAIRYMGLLRCVLFHPSGGKKGLVLV